MRGSSDGLSSRKKKTMDAVLLNELPKKIDSEITPVLDFLYLLLWRLHLKARLDHIRHWVSGCLSSPVLIPEKVTLQKTCKLPSIH